MTSTSPMKLLGLPALLLAIVVVAVFYLFTPIWVAALVGVFAGTAFAVIVRRTALSVALAELGARPIADDQRERIDNVVEGLCLSGGFTPPRIHVVGVAAPDAALVGRGRDDSDLVVTTGALDDLSRLELEALMARSLCLLDTDVESATVLCALGRLLGGKSLARRYMRSHLDAKAVVVADYAGVKITRYPPALASAMTSARDAAGVPARVTTDHLWLFGPVGVDGPPRPPLDQRIDTLQEL